MDLDLDYQIEVLNAVEGVTAAKGFGVEGKGNPNSYGVALVVHVPDQARERVRVPCAAERPTKLDCVRVLKRRVDEMLGAGAVETAERTVMVCA